MTQTIRKIDRNCQVIEIWYHPNDAEASTTDALARHCYNVHVEPLQDYILRYIPKLSDACSTSEIANFDLSDFCDKENWYQEQENLMPEILAFVSGMKYRTASEDREEVFFTKNLNDAFDAAENFSC